MLRALLLADTTTTTAQDTSMPPWAYIFWLWLAVSLGVYGYRGYRKWFVKTDGGEEGTAGASGAPATGVTSLGARAGATDTDALTPTQQLFREELARRQGLAPDAPAAAADAPTGPAAGGTPGPAAPGPAADSGAWAPDGTPASERSGLFAPSPAAGGPPPPARKPVADLLSGIAMPCGLAPMIGAGGAIDPHRVAFTTNTAPPAEVGSKVGDELERLGFALRSTGDTELEARRDGDVLVVRLYPDARAAEGDDGAKVFPHAPLDSVGVVFSS